MQRSKRPKVYVLYLLVIGPTKLSTKTLTLFDKLMLKVVSMACILPNKLRAYIKCAARQSISSPDHLAAKYTKKLIKEKWSCGRKMKELNHTFIISDATPTKGGFFVLLTCGVTLNKELVQSYYELISSRGFFEQRSPC